jgi:TolB-like protein
MDGALVAVGWLLVWGQVGPAPTPACRELPAQDVVTVAVLDLRARDLPKEVADSLVDAVAEEAARVPGHKVLSRKDMEAMINEEARKQMLGCDETSCLAELAGALNATLLVSGEVARLGGDVVLTLQLINHRYATVVNRVTLSWGGPTEQLLDVARAAAQLLVMEKGLRTPGSIEMEGAPTGATVTLDGKRVTGTRLEGVEVGVHVLRVSAPGHDGRAVPVVVRSGVVSRAHVALSGIPLYRRGWFWGGGGVAGVVLGTTVLAVVGVVPVIVLVGLTGGGRVTTTVTVPTGRRER